MRGARRGSVDGGDAVDVPARAARCAAGDRLRRAQRLCADLWAAAEAQGL